MTRVKNTSVWVAIAVALLGTACGGATEPAGESPTSTESADSRIDGAELDGVHVDVRRDPG
jgi:hypothetical protein